MKAVRVAAVQMTSGADVTANLATATALIEAAAEAGARMVVLPENFAAMGRDEADRCALAEPDGDGPLQDFLAATAARCRVWLVGGTVPIAGDEPSRPFASALVFADDGRRVARYDKMHLFDVGIPGSGELYGESRHTQAGTTPSLVETPWGGLLVAVCYDLRFPELFRHFPGARQRFIALPAAFTAPTGEAHWATLVRARAIENLCFVIAAAQTGRHENGRCTHGHSMIVSPWGETIAEAPEAPGFIVGDLDLAFQDETRNRFPALAHRRL